MIDAAANALDTEDDLKIADQGRSSVGRSSVGRSRRSVQRNIKYRWPNSLVSYRIDPRFDAAQTSIIDEVLTFNYSLHLIYCIFNIQHSKLDNVNHSHRISQADKAKISF